MHESARRGCGLAWAVALTACGGSAIPVAPAPAVEPAHVWLVDRVPDPVSTVIVLQGIPPVVGTRGAIVEANGVAGLAVTTTDPPPDCDDCPTDRFVARFESGARAPLDPALAATLPVADDARVMWQPYPPIDQLDDVPQVWAAVNLDSDGQADLEIVVRCGEYAPSGCDARVCSQVCRALRDVGSAVLRDETCHRFIPDVDDCLPEGDADEW